jgi:hypothetical protein
VWKRTIAPYFEATRPLALPLCDQVVPEPTCEKIFPVILGVTTQMWKVFYLQKTTNKMDLFWEPVSRQRYYNSVANARKHSVRGYNHGKKVARKLFCPREVTRHFLGTFFEDESHTKSSASFGIVLKA